MMNGYDLRQTGDFKRLQDDLLLKSRLESFFEQKGVKPLFAAINGAHLWGLQSSESDIDIHGIYLKPTLQILDMHPGDDTIQAKIDIGNGYPEIELQFHELQKFMHMLMHNNGNVITMVNSPFVVYTDHPDLIPGFWPSIASAFLTKQLRHYFKGYAYAQKKRALSTRGGKALIYTYREMFSGMYLMKFGKLEFSFQNLLEVAKDQGWYPPAPYSLGLLYKYYKPGTGNLTGLVDTNDWNDFFLEWDLLANQLEILAETSMLPDSVDGYNLCNSILKAYRIESMRSEPGFYK